MCKGSTTLSLAIAVAVALIAALPAASATRSSISLVMPSASTTAPSTGPRYGDQVTFAINTSTAFPWVDTACSQNGGVVYEQWAGFFDTYTGSKMFTLGPTQLADGRRSNVHSDARQLRQERTCVEARVEDLVLVSLQHSRLAEPVAPPEVRLARRLGGHDPRAVGAERGAPDRRVAANHRSGS